MNGQSRLRQFPARTSSRECNGTVVMSPSMASGGFRVHEQPPCSAVTVSRTMFVCPKGMLSGTSLTETAPVVSATRTATTMDTVCPRSSRQGHHHVNHHRVTHRGTLTFRDDAPRSLLYGPPSHAASRPPGGRAFTARVCRVMRTTLPGLSSVKATNVHGQPCSVNGVPGLSCRTGLRPPCLSCA